MKINLIFKYLFFSFILLFSFTFLSSNFIGEVNATESLECTLVTTYVDIDADGVADTMTAMPVILAGSLPACVSVDAGSLGFKIPTLGDILTFAIRVLFVVAGLAALFYLLLGAFAWVTSGGDKDAVTAAREKIQAAVIGMILIVGVLAIIWTLEQVIFNRRICLGLSCPLTLPGLLTQETMLKTDAGEAAWNTSDANCCVCLTESGSFGERINTFTTSCKDGVGVGI